MSDVPVRGPDGQVRNVDTFERTVEGRVIHTQATANADPATGAHVPLATEATLQLLAAAADAIRAAAETLAGRPAGLTDAQLRAAPVPVQGVAAGVPMPASEMSLVIGSGGTSLNYTVSTSSQNTATFAAAGDVVLVTMVDIYIRRGPAIANAVTTDQLVPAGIYRTRVAAGDRFALRAATTSGLVQFTFGS